MLRSKLWKCLEKRCRNEGDKRLVDLIKSLHHKQVLEIGENAFETAHGVAQGSVLAPLLFNVYLEEAL